METLISPKSEYLLEAGLDVLHFESKEWVSELKFLKSELDFFLMLLNSKIFKLDEEPKRQHIYENMNKLCTIVLTEVEQEVKAHEKNLAELLRAKSGTDAPYRAQHKQLKAKVNQLDNDVRTLKMLVFRFVEHIK